VLAVTVSKQSLDNLETRAAPTVAPDEDIRSVAAKIYHWIETDAINTIDWYFREKTTKARWSRLLRFSSVTLVTLGTVFPVVAVGMQWTENSIWGYGLIGLGAGCIALDKVFGFSSSWTRYLTTATALRRSLTAFQIEWAKVQAASDATDEQALKEAYFTLASRFVDATADLVERETLSWVTEFQNSLLELETEAAQSRSAR